jgi:hypothetical protein
MIRVATRFDYKIKEFIHNNPDTSCRTLVGILIKYGVCRSEAEGRLAIVPALINCGILFHWPSGYKTPPISKSDNPKYDAKRVYFNWPRH